MKFEIYNILRNFDYILFPFIFSIVKPNMIKLCFLLFFSLGHDLDTSSFPQVYKEESFVKN